MGLRLGRVLGLDGVSPEIARQLVDTLFRQRVSLAIGGAAFMALGLIAYTATQSSWYLAAVAATGLISGWRLAQAYTYQRRGDTASPAVWAMRCMAGAWAMGAVWGAWGATLLFEQDPVIVIMSVGVQSGCMIAGAARNNGVLAVAGGQIVFTLVPTMAFCALSPNPYLHIYALFIALHIAAAFALTKALHRQTRLLLLSDEEKSSLVNRLEAFSHEMEAANQHLEALATTDALTGVPNRRLFDLTAAREWRRALREQVPLSLLMIDVDHFKAYNDTYGHPAGDECLRQVAAAIRSVVRRPGDLVARYGGEEFVVLLTSTYLNGAARVADLALTKIAAAGLVHSASAFARVTASVGVAWIIPNQDNTLQTLIDQADAALYAAKRGGRNRVHAAPSEGASGQMPISLPGWQ